MTRFTAPTLLLTTLVLLLSARDLARANADSGIMIQFDFSHDTTGFFDSPDRRVVLQLAAHTLTARLGDDLAAIVPNKRNTWSASFLNPPTGNMATVTNLVVPSNTLIVFVGARKLPGTQTGQGGPGGFSASGRSSFLNTVAARGESGALRDAPTDFGPWGGSITFDQDTNWHFGTTVNELGFSEADFLTTALHELGHVLGFGTAPSWTELVVGEEFTGPAAIAEYDADGNVPLSPTLGHWIAGTTEEGALSIMTPSTLSGTRTAFGKLDFAGLDDIGWDLIPAATFNLLAGDANNDNQVTGADLIIIQQNFGKVDLDIPTTGLFPGDANDDGQVTGADLIVVQQKFGDALRPIGAEIPEPASVCLLALSGLGAIARWHRI